ncbi:carboxypeptidase-like regulatory domain-containing protein [Aquirufa rosea]|uniref:Carboxypeptidase-like regulatory domain-containing protein n=1 Tax=Aquirufa rosea TaxID=2509241 RepID=A0A4Q1BZH2_9BACT|nr:carboxypeptidase-like regulatory domain-containing protein [Aquirufa rosea]RXK48899.1 carboxypeptidase-like regulatory domain-containing protein [Aquirufa rosea]
MNLFVLILHIFLVQDTPINHLNGQILDKRGNPLPGVCIRSNQLNVYTDEKGHFQLKNASRKIKISAIGYLPKTQQIDSQQKQITIILEEQIPISFQQP